jgi:hypothetical protein
MKKIGSVVLILSLLGCSDDLKSEFQSLFKEEILLHCVGKKSIYHNNLIPSITFEENQHIRVKFSKFFSDKKVWIIEREKTTDFPKEKSSFPEGDFEQKIGVTDRVIYNYVFYTDKKENTYLSDREDIDRLSGVWTRKSEVTDLKTRKVNLELTIDGKCEKNTKKF